MDSQSIVEKIIGKPKKGKKFGDTGCGCEKEDDDEKED